MLIIGIVFACSLIINAIFNESRHFLTLGILIVSYFCVIILHSFTTDIEILYIISYWAETLILLTLCIYLLKEKR